MCFYFIFSSSKYYAFYLIGNTQLFCHFLAMLYFHTSFEHTICVSLDTVSFASYTQFLWFGFVHEYFSRFHIPNISTTLRFHYIQHENFWVFFGNLNGYPTFRLNVVTHIHSENNGYNIGKLLFWVRLYLCLYRCVVLRKSCPSPEPNTIHIHRRFNKQRKLLMSIKK